MFYFVNWQNLLLIKNMYEKAKVIELFINVVRFSESGTETFEEAVLNSVKNQFSHSISNVKRRLTLETRSYFPPRAHVYGYRSVVRMTSHKTEWRPTPISVGHTHCQITHMYRK